MGFGVAGLITAGLRVGSVGAGVGRSRGAAGLGVGLDAGLVIGLGGGGAGLAHSATAAVGKTMKGVNFKIKRRMKTFQEIVKNTF